MVRHAIALLAMLLAASTSSESSAPLTSDQLKERLQGNYRAQATAADRLKASRGDTDSLRLLRQNEINYRLPNGSFVRGMLLPNGKVSPALLDGDTLVPACVTTDYVLVSGEWSGDAIRCSLKQEELAVLSAHDSARQLGIESDSVEESDEQGDEPRFSGSTKYSARKNKSEHLSTIDAPPISQVSALASGVVVHTIEESGQTETSSARGSIYVPPKRNNGKAKTIASVLRRDPNRYGVPIGTWVKAELVRPVSSAESGLIEFTLTEDLVGKYRTMPAGTVIFGEKAINEAEKRLESLSQIASLPDGTEVRNVLMRAFSLDKTAGISGTLSRDREGEFAAIGSNTALTAASALIPVAEGVAGTAVAAAKDGVIANEKRFSPKTPQAVIRVTPQPLFLKVARAF